MDLSKYHNPYDFANPVKDCELFIGREKELDEIKYYLDHAITALRPINLAILGQRAAGKTSLLNIAEIEAREREFCTVRIDLDEDDSRYQLSFFYKIFDSIFTEICSLDYYGGIKGKTYDTYLEIVNSYDVPEDKTFCPFIFPIQYAKAMEKNNVEVSLSEVNYKRDLKLMRDEINRPIIILFDESNVLAKSRINLEKIRNIFMNIDGYMLVFTGTPDLFPIIDDIFSPIIRQFKKITIDGFQDKEETRECIRRPLEKIGIVPEDIFDFNTLNEVEEIHELSSGRPYEVQLICHMLFKRVQLKKAGVMKLDLSVLEDVRKELENTQDISKRPIISKIKKFSPDRLKSLKLLCSCNGNATFDQIWSIEYIFKGEERWSKQELNEQLQLFIKENILYLKDDIIHFVGDDFDKIYIKYYTREHDTLLPFPDFPLEIFFQLRLSDFLRNKSFAFFLQDDSEIELETVMNMLANKSDEIDVFVEIPHYIAEAIYFLNINYRNNNKITLVTVDISVPWFNFKIWMHFIEPKKVINAEICRQILETIEQRIKDVKGNVIYDEKEFTVVPLDDLIGKVLKTDNENSRKNIAFRHAWELVDAYLEKKDIENAKLHAELSYSYNPDPAQSICNNLGYFFMKIGDTDKAKDLFEKSIKKHDEGKIGFGIDKILPKYNLCILEAMCGNLDKALEYLEFCIEQLEKSEQDKMSCGCLFIPELTNGALSFKESFDKPDLLDAIKLAKKILK